MDDSQDTKPVEPAHGVHGRDQTGAPADTTFTLRPLCLQATIGTQTDEMDQLGAETSLENETPITPTETTISGPTQPKGIRTNAEDGEELILRHPKSLHLSLKKTYGQRCLSLTPLGDRHMEGEPSPPPMMSTPACKRFLMYQSST